MSDSPFSPLYISPLSSETTICIIFEMVQCDVLFTANLSHEPGNLSGMRERKRRITLYDLDKSICFSDIIRTFHAFQLPFKRSLYIWIKTNNISESVFYARKFCFRNLKKYIAFRYIVLLKIMLKMCVFTFRQS